MIEEREKYEIAKAMTMTMIYPQHSIRASGFSRKGIVIPTANARWMRSLSHHHHHPMQGLYALVLSHLRGSRADYSSTKKRKKRKKKKIQYHIAPNITMHGLIDYSLRGTHTHNPF